MNDSRPRVCVLAKNAFVSESRLLKETLTLSGEYAVTVIALQESGQEPLEESIGALTVRRIPNRGGIVHRTIPFNLGRWLWDMGRMVPRAMALRAQVYHCHNLNTLVVGYLAARRVGARLVYDSHELLLETWPMALRPAWYRRLVGRYEGWFARRADLCIQTSTSRAERFQELHGIKAEVLRNRAERVEGLRPKNLKSELKIPPDKLLVAYVGAIMWGRGLAVALRALVQVPDVHLVFIGGGSLQAELEAMVQRLGLSDRAHFLGAVPAEGLLDVVAGADVGLSLVENVCGSYYFEVPTKVYEYMMVGLPQISSDFPEVRRVLEDSGCGIPVDPSSPWAVADAIRRLRDDPAERARMGASARRAALDRYHWELEAAHLLELYDRLLNAERREREPG